MEKVSQCVQSWKLRDKQEGLESKQLLKVQVKQERPLTPRSLKPNLQSVC